MNDKCAGGTGAVIDKINAKLKIPRRSLAEQGYHGIKLHKVAGKCGVFAETDINGLQKVGTPPDELMASLFEAIVLQNLSVLTRGHTLRPHVLLLGGPNSFIRGMREAWQANIPRMWQERKVEIPDGAKPEDLIKVPQNAQYFAALGAIEFGKSEDDCVGCYRGYDKLLHYIDFGRQEEKAKSGGNGLVKNADELDGFQERTAARSSFPPLSRKARLSAVSSASTADPLPPKPFCSTKMATFSARPISSRTAIPFRTRSRCSRTCAARWKRRTRNWKFWASPPPATRRIF